MVMTTAHACRLPRMSHCASRPGLAPARGKEELNDSVTSVAHSTRRYGLHVALMILVTVLGGCGTVYIDPEDENPRYVDEKTFVSTRGAEMTYRRIYKKLYQCTSGFYRIKGDYDAEIKRGVISVDTGAGLENDLYFANAHIMRITVERDDSKTSIVTIQQTERDDTPYAGVMEGWVNDWREACQV